MAQKRGKGNQSANDSLKEKAETSKQRHQFLNINQLIKTNVAFSFFTQQMHVLLATT